MKLLRSVVVAAFSIWLIALAADIIRAFGLEAAGLILLWAFLVYTLYRSDDHTEEATATLTELVYYRHAAKMGEPLTRQEADAERNAWKRAARIAVSHLE
jgi:hypothetical protein